MAITQLPAPCWYAKYPGGEDYQNLRHFESEDAAKRDAKEIHEEDPERTAEVGQWPGPCWEARCDGECGENYQDDEVAGIIHFPSRAEAEQILRESGWHVLKDGRDFCFDDEPEDGEPEVAAVIPGQMTLGEVS